VGIAKIDPHTIWAGKDSILESMCWFDQVNSGLALAYDDMVVKRVKKLVHIQLYNAFTILQSI